MAGNADLVRSIYADWERGDFTSAEWADPQIEFAMVGGPESRAARGRAEMARVWGDWLGEWDDFRAEAEEIRDLDEERVLVLTRNTGRGKQSGLELGQTSTRGANVFHVRDGKVTKLVVDSNRDHALAELGVPETPPPRAAPPAAVKLRDFRPDDAEAVHRWFNDERVTADLVGHREEFTIDDARGWVERAMGVTRDRKWAITIDSSDDAVGFVALFGLERDVGPELAVLVGDPAAWGKGVAREAERQACIEAFRTHGTHRINAEIPATNGAAQKVVTFLGFRREGVMRAAIRRGDEAIDNEIWGLLPEDFTGWDRAARS